jgi:hypothetical protein
VIIGPNTSGVVDSQNDSGIQLSGVQTATITGMTIKDVDGDFVTVSGLLEAADEAAGGSAAFPSVDVTISDNSFDRSGRQGVTPEYVNGVTITHNSFTGVAASNIDMEADAVGGCACDVDVDHNTFSGPVAYLVAGLTGLSIQHFTFANNVLNDGAQMKLQLAPQLSSGNITIADNSGADASTWPWPSIGIAYSVQGNGVGQVSGVVISGNSFPAPTNGQPFVRTGSEASDVSITANTIFGATPSTLLINGASTPAKACGNTAKSGGPLIDGSC